MDRLVYIAMTGASENFEQQAIAAHNLANASTTGYRADTSVFTVAPVIGPGLATRAYAVQTSTGTNLENGTIQKTDRSLDVAIQGSGWIAVQGLDGQEAYTRDGSFQVSADGTLQTRNGLPVLSDGGPITIPQDTNVTIGKDGTISAVQIGQEKTNVVIGQIKLVDPSPDNISKGLDGLFRIKDGSPAPADPNVTLVAGALEGSNVNPVAAMVDMINLARQFETQMKLVQSADTNAQRATQLITAT